MADDLAEREWRQILDLAMAAAELPQEQRLSFVESSSGDPRVRTRVLELAEEFAVRPDPSKFEIGSQVGRFTITGRIGRGGMGQVFSAMDSDLHRTVALKVLHTTDDDAADSSKLFREARTVSALNHSNIVTIYEVLKVGSEVAIVMEFVPGDSLRHWIHTPRTPADSSAVMLQIASAIQAAHEAGIVHRDLKPENVIVRPDKRVKVLDFGLARSASHHASSFSVTGNLAGTFRYMAPEQWAGKPLTPAIDIFSLGVIFYEIVTGKHPFDASSPLEMMKSVSEQKPPAPSSLNAPVTDALDVLIMRMLSKSPESRQQAWEVATALAAIDKAAAGEGKPVNTAASSRRRLMWSTVAVVLLLAAALGLANWGPLSSTFSRSRIGEDFTVLPLANDLGFNNSPTFSPDGHQLAYTWNGRKQDNFDIYLKVVGAQGSVRLTDSPEIDYSPAWSPDGKTIAFCHGSAETNAAIWTMSPLGGDKKKIYDLHWRAEYSNRHLSWSPDGKRLAFPDRSPNDNTNALVELDLSSGTSRVLTFPTEQQIDLQPAYSPDGRFLAFVRDQGGGINRIYILPLNETLTPYPLEWVGFEKTSISRPSWTPDSRNLLLVSDRGRENHLWVAPRERSGKPRLISSVGSNIFDAALSSTGKLALVYQHYDSDIYQLDLSLLQRGSPAIPEPIANSTRLELNPKVSPDGRKLAFESNRSGFLEVWTMNVDGTNPSPLTDLQHAVTGSPSWSYDGKKIVFDSRSGAAPRLYVADALGGKPTALTREEDKAVVPAWSIDDNWIYFSSVRIRTSEIWRIPARGGTPEQVTTNGGFSVSVAPDGKFLYYGADRGRFTELRALNLLTHQERVIARDVLRRNYVATRNGVLFVSGPVLGPRDLKMWDVSGQVKQIYRFEKPISEGLGVSPDGSTLYFGQMEQDGAELMLVDGFWH